MQNKYAGRDGVRSVLARRWQKTPSGGGEARGRAHQGTGVKGTVEQ